MGSELTFVVRGRKSEDANFRPGASTYSFDDGDIFGKGGGNEICVLQKQKCQDLNVRFINVLI